MKNPWTPGPWMWWTSCSFRRLSSKATGRDGDVLHGVVQRSDGHPDVVLPNGGWDGPDGRLIAAAPEMAAELASAPDISLYGLDPFDGDDFVEQYEAWVARVKALLARIRGDAP